MQMVITNSILMPGSEIVKAILKGSDMHCPSRKPLGFEKLNFHLTMLGQRVVS